MEFFSNYKNQYLEIGKEKSLPEALAAGTFIPVVKSSSSIPFRNTVTAYHGDTIKFKKIQPKVK